MRLGSLLSLVALGLVTGANVKVENVRRWVSRQGLREFRDGVVGLGVESLFDLPLLEAEDLASTG